MIESLPKVLSIASGASFKLRFLPPTLLYINDDFFLSISLSFILFVFLLDRLGEEDDLSTFFITVRGSAKISAKDTPGTAAVLTNFSIDSAHKSRPRYRAHWGAVYPRPKSRREQLAPEINKSLEHLTLPCIADFINGVNPKVLIGSTLIVLTLLRRNVTT